MNEFNLKTVRSDRVGAYHFVFEHGGWATFYIDDERGTLAVVSDWGTRSYRWGRGAWLSVDPPDLSRALLHFTANNHYDYVTGKLFSGDREEYDQVETLKEFKRHLISRRRDGWLERDEARELWTQLLEIDFYDRDNVLREIASFSRSTTAHVHRSSARRRCAKTGGRRSRRRSYDVVSRETRMQQVRHLGMSSRTMLLRCGMYALQSAQEHHGP